MFYFVNEVFEDALFNFGTIVAPLLVAIFLFLFAHFLAPVANIFVLFRLFGVILLTELRDARIRAVKHFDIFNKKAALLIFLYDSARVEYI